MSPHDGFAVLDVETTGLYPEHHDRIVELAVLRLDNHGVVQDKYATLVNPNRDVGASHIHGITASDVRDAPSFQEVAGDVLFRLRGTVLVAHNASFDRRFLVAEFARLNLGLPSFPTLCTMRLAFRTDRHAPGRKLESLCGHFGIEHGQFHCALDDAAATAELFRKCIGLLGGWDSADMSPCCLSPLEGPADRWPTITPSGLSYQRDSARRDIHRRHSFISQLIARLPATGAADPDTTEYLSFLDRVLEDRRVTPDELAELQALLTELGMSQEQTKSAHLGYLKDMYVIALQDGVITDSECADLEIVREFLGLTRAEAEHAQTMARGERDGGASSNIAASPNTGSLKGQTICFTGAMQCSINGERATRGFASSTAEAAGMVVKPSVTKSLDILVVADPESSSRKATKARAYGTRVIAEAVFWKMMGVGVE